MLPPISRFLSLLNHLQCILRVLCRKLRSDSRQHHLKCVGGVCFTPRIRFASSACQINALAPSVYAQCVLFAATSYVLLHEMKITFCATVSIFCLHTKHNIDLTNLTCVIDAYFCKLSLPIVMNQVRLGNDYIY